MMIISLAAFCIIQQLSFQEISCKPLKTRPEKTSKQKTDAPLVAIVGTVCAAIGSYHGLVFSLTLHQYRSFGSRSTILWEQ